MIINYPNKYLFYLYFFPSFINLDAFFNHYLNVNIIVGTIYKFYNLKKPSRIMEITEESFKNRSKADLFAHYVLK